MFDVVLNLGALTALILMARWLAQRGLFFALMTACGLVLAVLITLRVWSLISAALLAVIPVSDPVGLLLGFLASLLLTLQPVVFVSQRLREDWLPAYPRAVEVIGGFLCGTISAFITISLIATTLTLLKPVGLAQYDRALWWWPADVALLRGYQWLESRLAPHAAPTPLPDLTSLAAASTADDS